PDSVVARSFANVAVQRRLGLLSKRRARIDPVDRNKSGLDAASLIWIKSSSERSRSATRPLSSAHRPIRSIRHRCARASNGGAGPSDFWNREETSSSPCGNLLPLFADFDV